MATLLSAHTHTRTQRNAYAHARTRARTLCAHSPATDVWAIGITLYQMVYGTLPFWNSAGNRDKLSILITHGQLFFPVSPSKLLGARASGEGRRANGGASKTLEGHDPIVGYLKVRAVLLILRAVCVFMHPLSLCYSW